MNLQNQIEYLREFDLGDMFDECSVPFGLDMERVRGAIVMRCGLMIPLFSDPLTQRAATQQFFFENQWNFEHILNVLRAEYSPIENVAELREETTTSQGSDSLTIERDASEQHSGSDEHIIEEHGSSQSRENGTTGYQESGSTQTTESGTTGSQESETTTTQESGTTRTERKISAENISTYSPDNEETITHGKADEVSRESESTITHGKGESVTHGKGETVTHGKGEEVSDNKNTDDTFNHGHMIQSAGYDVHSGSKNSKMTFSVNRHGNIGVTTNQDMINQELDLMIRFNAYRFIADLYEKELILGIY